MARFDHSDKKSFPELKYGLPISALRIKDSKTIDTITIIKDFQCSGCVNGLYPDCFLKNHIGIGCCNHVAGTYILGRGRIFLGLPKGFCRLGKDNELKVIIFESINQQESQWPYGIYDVPVWKYKYNGCILIRGFQPRINNGFLHVIIEDNLSKYNCYEITKKDIEFMD